MNSIRGRDIPVKEEKKGKFDKWEVEDALRTLQRAEEIRKDEKLMKEVVKFGKEKIKEIRSISDLKTAYTSKVQEENEAE